MNTSKTKPAIEEVKLSFVGLDADKGLIDVRDLTQALEGWREYWEISTSLYLNKELSAKPLPQDARPQIKIRALKHSSFDIFTYIIIPLSLMVGYDIIKFLWKWRKALLRRHIQSKTDLISKEQALEYLIKLSDEFDISTKNTMEAVKALDLIDEALNDFVEPIDHSATTIIITNISLNESMKLTSSDKRALRSWYHLEPGLRSKGFERFSIRFIRINTETGMALISFENPDGLHKMGHEFSQIIDPNLNQPKNVYTRAFYEDTSLEVWGRMVRSKSSNKFVRWEITQSLPTEDTPLLDNTNST